MSPCFMFLFFILEKCNFKPRIECNDVYTYQRVFFEEPPPQPTFQLPPSSLQLRQYYCT